MDLNEHNYFFILGQCYISSVETDSPAHYAGLQVGDRVVEVDGAGVGLENHQQVVTRIAAAGDTLSMLVTDSTCEEYHSSRGIVITSALPHVVINFSLFNKLKP